MTTVLEAPDTSLDRPTRRELREHARAHRRVSRRVLVAAGLMGVLTASVANAMVGDDPSAQSHHETNIVNVIAPINSGVTASRVSTETVTIVIPAEAVTQADPYLPEGQTRVISAGVPGSAEVSYTVTWNDGVEVERIEHATVVTVSPTHDVVAVGTLDVPERPAIVAGSTRATGKQMAADMGWTGIQWQCLDNLWHRESGWRTTADNPTSSAYGIPQALPGKRMATHGADWETNPATQIAWGLDYIEGRYGTPCYAWGFFSNHDPHWY